MQKISKLLSDYVECNRSHHELLVMRCEYCTLITFAIKLYKQPPKIEQFTSVRKILKQPSPKQTAPYQSSPPHLTCVPPFRNTPNYNHSLLYPIGLDIHILEEKMQILQV